VLNNSNKNKQLQETLSFIFYT